tara:strand:- start:47 stop:586 length:540 start_codon:yes stop_codon:yes gene_type:complete
MNNTYESYELKLDQIINKLNNDKVILEDKEDKEDNIEVKKVDKNKQYETINYCYEMYKVRKNKKADFDIHSMNNLNIEDKDIDKIEKVLSWKELDDMDKNVLIDNYVDELYGTYLNKILKETIKIFVLKNKNKIRYNKKEKKIDTITGMICINNEELIIKKKTSNSNELINKLRKSIKR